MRVNAIGRYVVGAAVLGMVFGALAEQQQANHFQVDTISLRQGELCLQVDPGKGGRVSSVTLGEKELVFSASPEHPENNNWGSTFWLSPQALWGWPPVVAHDALPYRVLSFSEHSVSLESQLGSGARITKDIAISAGDTPRIDLTYTIRAEKDFPQVAAWEITRVPRDGLAFYPVTASSIKVPMGTIDYQLDKDFVVWQSLTANSQPPEGKLIANGAEGWLAWASEDLLYIKRYAPVPQMAMADGEGDIEVYVSGKLPYVELEVQSAARALTRGESLTWQVSWMLLELPEDLEVFSGNPKLIEFVRQTLVAAS